jgi:hypothetical protein
MHGGGKVLIRIGACLFINLSIKFYKRPAPIDRGRPLCF